MKHQEYTAEVMSVIGFTIIKLQRLELTLKYAWLLAAKREAPGLDAAWVLEDDPEAVYRKNDRKPLGQFLQSVREASQFRPSFVKRFERFVDRRNRLIHRVFKEKQFETLGNRRSLTRLHKLASLVFTDAEHFDSVFDAYLGMTFHILAETGQVEMNGDGKLREIMEQKRNRGELDMLAEALHIPKSKARTHTGRGSSGGSKRSG